MGVVKQLAVPFLAVNATLFLFQLWTFLFLEPGSADFTIGILASVFLLTNIVLSAALIRSNLDI
jgi:hypothetical protein